MKNKLILLALLCGCTLFMDAQNDSLKTHRHELGADVTGLLKQFFNFNANTNGSGTLPTYYVSYRYHLKKSNIRFGFGGAYSKRGAGVYLVNGEEKKFQYEQTNLSLRIGYEWLTELSKRWQAFYGLDLRPSVYRYHNPAISSNGGYLNGITERAGIYGLAPVLGFRFRINRRLSILTETSYSFNIEKSTSQKLSTSQNTSFPVVPNGKKFSETNIYSTFSQPLFLIFAFDL